LWTLALFVVFLFPLMLRPMTTASFFSTTLLEPPRRFDLVELYIPANPFYSLANTIVPAVVLFSLVMGASLIGIAEKVSGKPYGELRLGVSTGFLQIAGALLLRQSLIIAAAAIALAIVLQLTLGLWITRHLRQLIAAGEAMAAGDLSTRVPVRSNDEVGQLAAAFNSMAQSIADRIRELRASEAKFHAIADYSYGCELWLSPHGKLLWINTRVEAVVGYTPRECHAMPDFPYPLVSPAEWPRMREAPNRSGCACATAYRSSTTRPAPTKRRSTCSNRARRRCSSRRRCR